MTKQWQAGNGMWDLGEFDICDLHAAWFDVLTMIALSIIETRWRATDEDRKQFGPGKSFCIHEGCEKSALGSTKFCSAHGGGRRCTEPGCEKGAQGSTKFFDRDVV